MVPPNVPGRLSIRIPAPASRQLSFRESGPGSETCSPGPPTKIVSEDRGLACLLRLCRLTFELGGAGLRHRKGFSSWCGRYNLGRLPDLRGRPIQRISHHFSGHDFSGRFCCLE